MLVRCNLNCKKNVTTDASLDIDTNEAICNLCGETLDNVTSYAKQAMKSNGDIIKKKQGQAFTFNCETCNQNMQVISEGGELVGAVCTQKSECRFTVTDYMKRGIDLYSKIEQDEDADK